MARTLITLPPQVRRDEIIEIRTLIAHAMETGYRAGADGRMLKRDLIRRFSCTFDDGAVKELVFAAELHPAIAANPYLSFTLRATGNGNLIFQWEGDNGFGQSETVALRVT